VSLDVTEAEVSERRKTADFRPDLAAIRSCPARLRSRSTACALQRAFVVIEGGDDTPVTMPRTAFQLVYPERTA